MSGKDWIAVALAAVAVVTVFVFDRAERRPPSPRRYVSPRGMAEYRDEGVEQ